MGLVILWAAQIGDILTSLWGLHHGYSEANPMLAGRPTLMVVSKLLILLITGVLWARLPRGRGLYNIWFSFGGGMTAWTVLQNLTTFLS